ncbi:MAG TPA: DUF1653 domain-containing protein [Candidatus Faecisoma merdavium]|nr:DUF1653 domain-containing protein [Candidatus Faecisoma merdavium]
MEVVVGGIYKHFKGNLYKVINIGYDSETNINGISKKLVIYEALYDDHKIWVRPYDMFVSKVDKEKYPDVLQEYRFELIDND